MQLTAELLEAFAGLFLSPRYDAPQPTPEFHRECWRRYCSDHPACATAAPRNHAKSTALTHDYILASVLFRVEPYVVLIGSTEEMAIEHLQDISNELHENEELIQHFGVVGFPSDAKTDIVCKLRDGYEFRIIARGAEQRIRGRKWKGRRPGLIVFDDIEEDEMVESVDRRRKFRRWFFRAAKQALRDGGRIRGHGTILHEDALLNRVIKDDGWDGVLYKAHAGFDDFSEILWPEKFPESRLRSIRQEFINQGDAPGYSQEYLNDPFDNSDAYLRKDDFSPMTEEDELASKIFYVGCDFAVSKADKANRTSFTVGGVDLANTLHIVDEYVGRWESSVSFAEQANGEQGWIDIMFDIQKKYFPDVWYVEDGVIWKAVSAMVYKEMQRRDTWMAITAITPIKDKAVRGRNFQKRHRAGGVRYNKNTEWYPTYEAELLRFTGTGAAIADDQFDSTSIMVKGLEVAPEVEEEDFMDEDELEMASAKPSQFSGANDTTGY